MRLVICEDEGLVAFDLRVQLERSGHTVLACLVSGEEAIEFMESHDADAIIMDVRLSGPMDGVDTVRRIQERTPIPAIFTSAYGDRSTRDRARGTRMKAFLDKPVNLERLLEVLAKGGTPAPSAT